MDILIKNMELPPKGEMTNITILSDGSVIEHFKNENGSWSSYKSCGVKAVALPEHSDLIDRKALFDSIVFDIQGVNTEGCYDDDEVELIRTTYQAVLYKLQNESPVIVEAST